MRHEHLSKVPGKNNWIEHTPQGQLPAYIQHIARDLHRERGFTLSHAIATAISKVKEWAAGGDNVKPDTQAKAAKAVAEWEALKAAAHEHTAGAAMQQVIELRNFSHAERVRAAATGHALPDLSYPIYTRQDLENAVRDYHRVKSGYSSARKAQVRKHILSWAARLGVSSVGLARPAMRGEAPPDARQVIGLASVNGRHVPGTPTHWEHNWVPKDLYTALRYNKVAEFRRYQREHPNAPFARPGPLEGIHAGPPVTEGKPMETQAAPYGSGTEAMQAAGDVGNSLIALTHERDFVGGSGGHAHAIEDAVDPRSPDSLRAAFDQGPGAYADRLDQVAAHLRARRRSVPDDSHAAPVLDDALAKVERTAGRMRATQAAIDRDKQSAGNSAATTERLHRQRNRPDVERYLEYASTAVRNRDSDQALTFVDQAEKAARNDVERQQIKRARRDIEAKISTRSGGREGSTPLFKDMSDAELYDAYWHTRESLANIGDAAPRVRGKTGASRKLAQRTARQQRNQDIITAIARKRGVSLLGDRPSESKPTPAKKQGRGWRTFQATDFNTRPKATQQGFMFRETEKGGTPSMFGLTAPPGHAVDLAANHPPPYDWRHGWHPLNLRTARRWEKLDEFRAHREHHVLARALRRPTMHKLSDESLGTLYSRHGHKAGGKVGRRLLSEVNRRDYEASRKRAVQQLRDEYRNFAEAQFLQAEEYAKGRLLNKRGRAAGVDPHALFTGSGTRAHAYASEELENFWKTHPRHTFAEFVKAWRQNPYDEEQAA